MKILGVDSTGGFSGGGGSYFFKALSQINEVRSIFVKLSKFQFFEELARSFRPYPSPNEKFPWAFFPYHKTAGSFVRRTLNCERMIERMQWKPDVVLQLGVYLSPTMGKKTFPYACYIDATSKMAEREYPPWGEMYRSKVAKLDWMNLQRILFLRASRVFTMSEYTRQSVIEDFHIQPDKVVVVYSGPNIRTLPYFEKDVSNKIILFVGGDFRRKGGLTLLRAFKEVNKRIPTSQLFIVGSSPKISGPGIIVKGFVKKEELTSLYKQASIFAMPSLFDPFPHVFMEAMAFKTPCIGANRDAMPEIIDDGKSGFTVPVQDPMKLAEKMIYLLENEDVAKKMGEEGRRKVEKSFNWDTVSKKITTNLLDLRSSNSA